MLMHLEHSPSAETVNCSHPLRSRGLLLCTRDILTPYDAVTNLRVALTKAVRQRECQSRKCHLRKYKKLSPLSFSQRSGLGTGP